METLERSSNVTIVDFDTTLERIVHWYVRSGFWGVGLLGEKWRSKSLYADAWRLAGRSTAVRSDRPAEVRGGKIWVHYDGTEAGITEELVMAGVLPEQIVLAFQPPYARKQTGYAIG